VGRHCRGCPPRPHGRPRWGQALVVSVSSWSPLMWLLPRPPLPATALWPQPWGAVAHLLPQRLLP
jgi:hypothetical protein